MKKLTPQNKKHLLTNASSSLRHRTKRKKRLYSYAGRRGPSVPTAPQPPSIAFEDIWAPRNFTLQFIHAPGVLGFISLMKEIGGQRKNIMIRLDRVEEIAEGAIAMLLSVMQELAETGIVLKGESPIGPVPNAVLRHSGFFKHMTASKVDLSSVKTKNIILKTGTIATQRDHLSPEVHKAMETIWGEKSRCPVLFGGIGEMLRNSCDHAFAQGDSVKWHIGFSHFENDNMVKFSFVDNGSGIVDTFRKRTLLRNFLTSFKDHADIVETAFRDGIESRTGLSWRGKGLPTIFEMYSDGIITNLVIITNNVYLDFDNHISETLSEEFQGTYYFWKMDKSCAKSNFPLTV